jgi:protein SCO1/2
VGLTLRYIFSAMSKKRIFYIIFFAALVVGFYFIISAMIPEYGSPKSKPISTIQPFHFLNQDNRWVTEKDLVGKVTAVNFFFTTCTSICPEMNNNLKPVYERFKDEPDFMLLSFTSDPQRDSVPVLRHYADSLNVNTEKWMFLTGRKDSLYAAARHSFKIDNPKNYVQRIEDDFLHTQFVALVDQEGKVVNIYDGLKPSELSVMDGEIQKLLKKNL